MKLSSSVIHEYSQQNNHMAGIPCRAYIEATSLAQHTVHMSALRSYQPWALLAT